jgi:hypothetical protein
MESRLGASLSEPLSDSDEGISSEDDLIAIAFGCVDDLVALLAEKILHNSATPQNIADWIHFLRNPLSIKPAFSKALIKNLEAATLQPDDMLRVLVLSLSWAGHHQAVANIQSKLASLFHNGFDIDTINSYFESNLVYSIDLYQNGYIMGWIYDKNHPLKKLPIEISQSRQVIAGGVADQFRQDLVDFKISDGCCAFRLKVEMAPSADSGPLVLRVIELEKEFQIQPTSIKGVI